MKTNEKCDTLDRSGNYSQNWSSSSSSDKRKLLCLGRRYCYYNSDFYSTIDLADEFEGLGIVSVGRGFRHTHGESSST